MGILEDHSGASVAALRLRSEEADVGFMTPTLVDECPRFSTDAPLPRPIDCRPVSDGQIVGWRR
jgi:hypothetical protein